ncbi:fungal-specific transcription factor domain-containing protein [Xylariaceae sp. AK1471]|nr:fungal-specific transcription factor domain-containing protein [Xylariaceae sp. AK1471]
MFTTFYSVTTPAAGRDDANLKTTPASRPKRSQVRRACDWCKLMRTKCENHRPCSNCRQANRDCTISDENHFRSLAEAPTQQPQQDQRVQQVQHGEREQPTKARAEQSPVPKVVSASRNTTAAVLSSSSPTDFSEASLYPKSNPKTDRLSSVSASRNSVRVDSIPYGVTSLPFFLTRMDQFLQTSRQQSQLRLDLDIFTCAAGAGQARTPRSPALDTNRLHPQQDMSTACTYEYLPRAQETLYLDLFWQTHYFSFPILNEGQFRKEYKSLWDESPTGGLRKASPLVDIVVALCIQLGGFLVRQSNHESDSNSRSHHNNGSSPDYSSPSLGGYQYYRRCQETIDRMIESPSIDNVQCYIFSIVYLYEAGLLNRAHVVAGKAIMMAMMLGLPDEPQSDEPEPQKEVARRTWWSLYILDAKLSMEVGRPPMIGPSHSTCHLPSDSNDVARWLGPHYSFDDSCPTWLGFQTQTLRLLDAVRSVRSVLYTRYDAVVGANGYKDFVSNATAREECACLLTEQMKELNAWARQVPGGYLVSRRDGQSFSTDRTPLEFEVDMIIHCQRQRLLLELQYHQYCMSLYQPFICFESVVDELTPVSDAKAAAALAHAMTLTSMIHQTLTNTEALSGIYHVFRWQKNALFTMLGFAYTFPITGSATATRRSIELAIAVIDMYRDILPEAGPVAAVARVLAEDVGAIVAGFSTGKSNSSPSAAAVPVAPASASPSTQSPASDVQTMILRPTMPTTELAPGQQDWNMMAMPPSMDKMLGRDFLHQLGEEGANIEAMDMLWANFDPNDVSNVDSWISMGDSMIGGFGRGEMDVT